MKIWERDANGNLVRAFSMDAMKDPTPDAIVRATADINRGLSTTTDIADVWVKPASSMPGYYPVRVLLKKKRGSWGIEKYALFFGGSVKADERSRVADVAEEDLRHHWVEFTANPNAYPKLDWLNDYTPPGTLPMPDILLPMEGEDPTSTSSPVVLFIPPPVVPETANTAQKAPSWWSRNMGLPNFTVIATTILIVVAVVHRPVQADAELPVYNKDIIPPSMITPDNQPMITVDVPDGNVATPKESDKKPPQEKPQSPPQTTDTGTEADWTNAPGTASGQPSAPPPEANPPAPEPQPAPSAPIQHAVIRPENNRGALMLMQETACYRRGNKDGVCYLKVINKFGGHISFDDDPWAKSEDKDGRVYSQDKFGNSGIRIGNCGSAADPGSGETVIKVTFPLDKRAVHVHLFLPYLAGPMNDFVPDYLDVYAPINEGAPE